MNQLNVITCYWKNGTWCFDDKARDLLAEPFVASADAFITDAAKIAKVKDPIRNGVRVTFSHASFPGHQFAAFRQEAEAGGYWYQLFGRRGWLCPALFKYFAEAPERIYFAVA